MKPTSELRERLLEFDGKAVAPLEDLASELTPSDATIRRFLSIADDPEEPVEVGATWIVKNLAERRGRANRIAARLASTLVNRLMSVDHTYSRLHLLQTLPHCDLGPATAQKLWAYLETLEKTEENGFTRGWLFNGFAEIARCRSQYREPAIAIMTSAYEDERPAVRARIRNALDEI